jgi:hypothetical protein
MFDERPVCQQGAGEQSEFMRQTNLCVKFMRQNLCVRREWNFSKVPIPSDAQIRRTNSRMVPHRLG